MAETADASLRLSTAWLEAEPVLSERDRLLQDLGRAWGNPQYAARHLEEEPSRLQWLVDMTSAAKEERDRIRARLDALRRQHGPILAEYTRRKADLTERRQRMADLARQIEAFRHIKQPSML
jgi:chromosome segregation ATPase